MEKLPGVAVAYPDSHVKGIKIRHGNKEATAIGLALPREAALLGVADEIIIAGRLFEEGDQPEAILGVQLAENLGFSAPKDAIGAEITVEAAVLASDGGLLRRPQGADGENRRHLPGPADHAGSAQQGSFCPSS